MNSLDLVRSLLVAAVTFGPGGLCLAQPRFEFGPLTELRTDEGRLSFGTIVSVDVVSWSAADAQDLLIARLWDGVYLYPSKDLRTIGEPIRLCDQLGHVVLMVEPVDWDGDGRQEAIGTDRQGKIFCLKRVGEYPNVRLERAQDPLATSEGLPLNIPFVNPKYRLSDKPESLWPEDFSFTEILTDHRGRRYLLENDTVWHFRELLTADGKVQLSSKRHPLLDQNGVFRVDGDTDAQHMTNSGFHRAALWDYDGSGRQHLIVGTDKGWLYLLRLETPLGRDGRFTFRSFGPLKDTAGGVIRVHHRTAAAPIDLDGDGRLDLVLAGATYGRGDPNPGSGIYYVRNAGEAADHSPVLSPVRRLQTIGHTHPDFKHAHAQLQALDLLGSGEKLLIVGTQLGDDFRGYVYRPARNRIALEHTGTILPPISIEERLLDLDGDGKWEYVRSGGESLIAKYAKVAGAAEKSSRIK